MTETNKRAAFIPAASNGVVCRVPINIAKNRGHILIGGAIG